MLERSHVTSSHFGVKHAIAGHNVHTPATQRAKLRWYIYMEECVHPEGVFQYVGSTTSMTERWSNTKSKINSGKKPSTGLETHFKEGCSQNLGPDLGNVRITLMEHMDTTHKKLIEAMHQPGPGCRCTECGKLKSLEDKWICRIGSYHGTYGLNDRDEITNKVRSQYWRWWMVRGWPKLLRYGRVPEAVRVWHLWQRVETKLANEKPPREHSPHFYGKLVAVRCVAAILTGAGYYQVTRGSFMGATSTLWDLWQRNHRGAGAIISHGSQTLGSSQII